VVDQDLLHSLGRGGEEIATVRGVDQDIAIEQPQQRFVDQGAGLEGVAGPLVVHQTASDVPQLGIDGADEAVPGVIVTGTDLTKEGGQVSSRVGTHRSSLNFLEIDRGVQPVFPHACGMNGIWHLPGTPGPRARYGLVLGQGRGMPHWGLASEGEKIHV
jgi:hypothetical protein